MWKNLCPDEVRPSVYAIDYERLWKWGFRVLIFDIDNTLGSWGCKRLEESPVRLLEGLAHRGFRLGFLSNNRGLDRDALVAQLAPHRVLWNAQKPRIHGLQALLQQLGAHPSEAVLIGDQIFTDIWGAKRARLYAILVAPYDPKSDSLGAKLRRPLERWILRHCRSTVAAEEPPHQRTDQRQGQDQEEPID
ncbi:MAG: HAD hydrolase-like protein [Candidatus Bipolaricaulota bacterium]|nr:HAD hydrolase-like protein [Candidatus Bipolaricaulota bacterium]MCS7275097.1 HAD hydrolase-like protein [Candidatus Bipolaricaulota bacterium]MDW8110425.1 HAD hydrolase-like protein [Candidatus Bipolaricaulota bacterium]MDW8329723.1 HAD hydrolase-like protein [Candidatus Bipolaricaulota bacterium]